MPPVKVATGVEPLFQLALVPPVQVTVETAETAPLVSVTVGAGQVIAGFMPVIDTIGAVA